MANDDDDEQPVAGWAKTLKRLTFWQATATENLNENPKREPKDHKLNVMSKFMVN